MEVDVDAPQGESVGTKSRKRKVIRDVCGCWQSVRKKQRN